MTNPTLEVSVKYKPLYKSKARYNLLYGGRAAGRTFAAIQYTIIRLCDTPYARVYFMRQVFGDIKESLWREFNDMIEALGIEDDFHLNTVMMTAVHKRTGNMLISKGFKKSAGNQTAKLKSIAGATDVIIEEADEVDEQDFDKLDDSLRTTKSDLRIVMMLNTEHGDGWIPKRWFINEEPKNVDNLLAIKTSYLDNLANVNESTIRKFDEYKEINPEYYRIFVLGEWGKAKKGQIFTNWKAIESFPDEHCIYGLDFGYTNDPTALVRVYKHNQKLYIQEVIYRTGLTNRMIAKLAFDAGITKNDIIYADSAEPKSIDELKMLGLNVKPAVKGKDSVNAGISFIKEHIVHLTKNSSNIWEEYRNYCWEINKAGELTNKPIDMYNHSFDALRYGLFTHYSKNNGFFVI